MKVLDRLELIDRIGRELQSRMGYSDIAVFLNAHGVDTKKQTSGINSKWVYTKELLSDESDSLIVRIATELSVPHNHVVADPTRILEATFWEPFHLRLFLSHLSSFKKNTALLQAALLRYGISAFVAHVDIDPTREWMDEIEAGLHSMDALVAILMPGFKESDWTDQEIGVAVGRGVLVIPVMKGLHPYGFISRYQGLDSQGKTIATIASDVFQILVKSTKTRTKMLSCLTETTIQSKSDKEAIEKLRHLGSVKDLPSTYLQKIQESAPVLTVLTSPGPLTELNKLLAANGLKPVGPKKTSVAFDDDIPF
jgi:hypothetical protein